MNGDEAFGVIQGERVHPCSLFAKKEHIDMTSCNFGIVPNVSDHFSIFTEELRKHAIIMKISEGNYYHHNGLSSNFTLLTNGEKPNYKPEVFAEYMKKSLDVDVPIHPKFRELANSIITA